jgi:hypothetical protein
MEEVPCSQFGVGGGCVEQDVFALFEGFLGQFMVINDAANVDRIDVLVVDELWIGTSVNLSGLLEKKLRAPLG